MQWMATKDTKRKREGKETEFYKDNVRVNPEKIENYKKRRAGSLTFPQEAGKSVCSNIVKADLTRHQSHAARYYTQHSGLE